jgi:hypothetical protein
MTIETILNSDMSVAYITDCATSLEYTIVRFFSCHFSCLLYYFLAVDFSSYLSYSVNHWRCCYCDFCCGGVVLVKTSCYHGEKIEISEIGLCPQFICLSKIVWPAYLITVKRQHGENRYCKASVRPNEAEG